MTKNLYCCSFLYFIL